MLLSRMTHSLFLGTATVVFVAFVLCTNHRWTNCGALVILGSPQPPVHVISEPRGVETRDPDLETVETPTNPSLIFPEVTVIAVFSNHSKARHVSDGIKVVQLPDTIPVLILQCQASYPVEWIFADHFPYTSDNLRSWHINASRSIGNNLWNISEFRFESNFTFIYRPPAEPRQQLCRRTGAIEGPVTRVHSAIHGRYLRLTVSHDTICDLPPPRYGNNTNCTYSLQLYKGKPGHEDKICCDTTMKADEYVGSKFFHRGCSNKANCRGLFQPTTSCFTTSEAQPDKTAAIDGICMGGSELAPFGNSGFIVCGDADVDADSVAVHYFASVLDLCPVPQGQGMHNKTKTRFPKLYLNQDVREDKLQNEMLTVCPMANQILYVGEQVEFKCFATYYYFANGFHFVLKRNKSGLITEELLDSEEVSMYTKNVPEKEIIMSSIQLTSTVTLNDTSVREIVCAGPVWDSYEWANKSQHLKVIKPVEPKFWKGDVEEIVLDGDMIITCNVTAGDPPPRLLWYSVTMSSDYMNVITNNAASIALEIKFDSWRQDLSRISCQAYQDRLGTGRVKEKIFYLKRKPLHPFPTVHVLSVTAGFLIVLLLVLCLIGRVFFKKTKDRWRSLNEGEIQEVFDGRQSVDPDNEGENLMEVNAWHYPYDRKFEVSFKDVHRSNEIGRGEFGKIYLGYWTKPNSETIPVALKKNLAFGTMIDFRASLYELKLLIFMGYHPNVVQLLGAITSNVRKREVYVMLEYCRHGALNSYLIENKARILSATNTGLGCRPVGQQLSVSRPNRHYFMAEELSLNSIIRMGLLTWVHQILDGLIFIESKKVIHGDLAGRNILLDSNLNAKICDFGMSHQVTREHYKYTGSQDMKKPFNSSAPEVLERCEYSFKSDVYSFGVLLWEIFSLGKVPWALVPSGRMLTILQRGECLGVPKVSYNTETGSCYEIQLIPMRIYEKMMECWRLEPSQRPTFGELRQFFTELQGPRTPEVHADAGHPGPSRSRAESIVL